MTKYRLKTGKAEEKVVNAYRKVEDTVTGTYRKIEDKVVDTYKRVENAFVEKFLEEVETSEQDENETNQ